MKKLIVNVLIWSLKMQYKWFTALCEQTNEKPIGIPLQRDPDAPCTMYEPVKRGQWKFADCETDGHYLCKGCVHNILHNKEIEEP